MQSRVGAEVSIAAGLEQVCVGKTGLDAIDLLVKYALDPVLQNVSLSIWLGIKKKKEESTAPNVSLSVGWQR
jgi:hypothetical protein